MGFTNDRNTRGYVVVEKLFYLDEDYAGIFIKNGLDTFEAVWNAEADIVDNPNLSRGGHSDVGILRLSGEDGNEQCFYLKRQVNHNCRRISNPFRGVPLAIREWENIQKLRKIGIQTMDVACVGHVLNREARGLLVTEALSRYKAIGEWLSQVTDPQQRQNIMRALGRLVGLMHLEGIKHGCFYPKHVFISDSDPLNIRLIDLEKAKPSFSKKGGLRDLDTFFRRTSQLVPEDKEHFMEAYLEAGPMSSMSPSSKKRVASQMMAVGYI